MGPGTRMPCLPAVYRPKKKWRLASQTNPRAYLEEADPKERQLGGETTRRCARWQRSVRSRTRREEVSSSGFWKQRQEPNQTAKSQRESFTMAPMVWQLLRRRLQDQQRSRNSSALKRATREKASRGLRTFALTADVKEAHRQVLIDPRDWHLLGCQSEPAQVCSTIQWEPSGSHLRRTTGPESFRRSPS